mmetsp:Transcript_8626/g.28420  ORF Transcript_8626/g.28420 Transcript_8626/m.28420 type:complete len:202 (+) Transcript_8626:2643-3248(+)
MPSIRLEKYESRSSSLEGGHRQSYGKARSMRTGSYPNSCSWAISGPIRAVKSLMMGTPDRYVIAVKSPSPGLLSGRTLIPAGSRHPSLSARCRDSIDRVLMSSLDSPSAESPRSADCCRMRRTGSSVASTSDGLAPRADSRSALASALRTALLALSTPSASMNCLSSSSSRSPSPSESSSAVSSAFHSSDVEMEKMFLVAA